MTIEEIIEEECNKYCNPDLSLKDTMAILMFWGKAMWRAYELGMEEKTTGECPCITFKGFEACAETPCAEAAYAKGREDAFAVATEALEKLIKRREATHGTCCTCGDCGGDKDNCDCSNNEWIEQKAIAAIKAIKP